MTMRLTDYVDAPRELKKQYFDTLTMNIGLRYFGGKSVIGKYIINRIMEMQAYRYIYPDYKPASTFVDCFTGGGKIGLTIPTGWFDKIVINDLNFGVYSYYLCCQKAPLALCRMIEEIGKIMSKEVFHGLARERSTPPDPWNKDVRDNLVAYLDRKPLSKQKEKKAKEIFPHVLTSAAITFWITQSSWLGETDPNNCFYALVGNTKSEKEEIEKRIRIAKKRIMDINKQMTRQEYIVENLDYVELIETYGVDEKGKQKEDVIWYLDPPYHAATLNKSNGLAEDQDTGEISSKNKEERPAPYEDSFEYEQTMAMTYLLSGMKWFIKSDYDPYYYFDDPNKTEKIRKGTVKSDYYHDFDIIENLDRGFVRELLGTFKKGTVSGHDVGMEVIWTRYDGTPDSVDYMFKGAKPTEYKEACDFWEEKKNAIYRRYLHNEKVNSESNQLESTLNSVNVKSYAYP